MLRAAVEDRAIARSDQLGRASGDATLALRFHRRAGPVVRECRRCRQSPAVDALAQAGRSEIAQVAPDAVLRDAELNGEGTGDDPELVACNLARLEDAAWPIFRAGHIPMIGEWVALPVLKSAGAHRLDDPLVSQVMYPTAQRLLEHCDAVLRLPGDSTGADQDVAIATRRGQPVCYTLEDIPAADRTPECT